MQNILNNINCQPYSILVNSDFSVLSELFDGMEYCGYPTSFDQEVNLELIIQSIKQHYPFKRYDPGFEYELAVLIFKISYFYDLFFEVPTFRSIADDCFILANAENINPEIISISFNLIMQKIVYAPKELKHLNQLPAVCESLFLDYKNVGVEEARNVCGIFAEKLPEFHYLPKAFSKQKHGLVWLTRNIQRMQRQEKFIVCDTAFQNRVETIDLVQSTIEIIWHVSHNLIGQTGLDKLFGKSSLSIGDLPKFRQNTYFKNIRKNIKSIL